MQLTASISNALKIEPGEGRPLALLLAHSFFAGIALVSFYVASRAMFLSVFPAEFLPYVYLTSAVVAPAMGWIYHRCERVVSFQALLTGTLVFLLLSVLVFYGSLGVGDSRWAVFGVLVWYSVVFALLNVELWGAASRLFTLQQGKRLFGLVAVGEIVASTIGGFATPVFMRLNGTPSLLVVSAAGLVFCLLTLGVMIRRYGERLAAVEETRLPVERKEGFRDLLKHRFVRLLFLGYMVAVTVYYLLEFLLYDQAHARYEDQETLARFFGNYMGLTQVLTLVLLTFVTARLITRMGIRISLRVRPVALLLSTVGMLVVGLSMTGAPAYFWLVLGAKLIDKVFYRAINSPCFLILYQPLPRTRRLATQVAIESMIGPLAGGVAGLILLSYRWLGVTNPVFLNLIIFALVVAWLMVGLRLYGAYRQSLSEAMYTRTLEGGAIALDEAEMMDVVTARLQSPHAGEVIYALDLLEKAGVETSDQLIGLLDHRHPMVRINALDRLKDLDLPEASPAIRSLLETEKEPRVQASALKALCEIEEAEDVETVAGYLEHPDEQIRAGAVVGLLRSGGLDGILTAGRQVISRERSLFPKDRAFVADVLGEVGIRSFYRPLLQLLKDPDLAVRRRALVAAGRVQSARLWPGVTDNLSDPLTYRDAMAALANGGDSTLALLRTRFGSNQTPIDIKVRIARVAGRIGSDRAVAFLQEHVGHEDREVRTEILHSLYQCTYEPAGSAMGEIHRLLREEAGDAAFALALALDLGDNEPWGVVRRALLREVHQIQRRCLYLLTYLFDARTLMHAFDNLQNPSPEQRAYALEVLDTTISRHLKPVVMPLFETSDPSSRLRRLNAMFPQQSLGRARRLLDIAGGSDRWRHPWTRACAIKLLIEQDHRDEVEVVLMARPTEERLTSEVLMWGLWKLQHPRYEELSEQLIEQCPAVGLAYERLNRWKEGDPPMLLTIEKVMVLRSVHVFAGVPEDVLANLSTYLEEIDVAEDEVVYQKGDTGDTMFIIVDGGVKVHDGNRTFVELGERDFFGELTTLDPEPHSATVTAVKSTRLLGLHREDLYELMSGYPEVLKGIIHELCNRLRGKRTEDKW